MVVENMEVWTGYTKCPHGHRFPVPKLKMSNPSVSPSSDSQTLSSTPADTHAMCLLILLLRHSPLTSAQRQKVAGVCTAVRRVPVRKPPPSWKPPDPQPRMGLWPALIWRRTDSRNNSDPRLQHLNGERAFCCFGSVLFLAQVPCKPGRPPVHYGMNLARKFSCLLPLPPKKGQDISDVVPMSLLSGWAASSSSANRLLASKTLEMARDASPRLL